MSTLKLFDEYELEYEPGSEEGWFLEWVLRQPKSAGTHLRAGAFCLGWLQGELPHLGSVYEAFGGIGGNALVVEKLWPKATHVVNEYDGQAVQFLKNNLPEKTLVTWADAYDLSTQNQGGLTILDFGDLTVRWTLEGDMPRKLLDEVFAGEPSAVMVTDVACRYLHLQRQNYERILGEGSCVDYPTYLDAFRQRLEELYGYTMLTGYTHYWSTVMCFTRPDLKLPPGDFHRTPSEPRVITLQED